MNLFFFSCTLSSAFPSFKTVYSIYAVRSYRSYVLYCFPYNRHLVLVLWVNIFLIVTAFLILMLHFSSLSPGFLRENSWEQYFLSSCMFIIFFSVAFILKGHVGNVKCLVHIFSPKYLRYNTPLPYAVKHCYQCLLTV